ncbi:TIR domain-containing protein [Saccharopolyspora kobensis]|uniref:TIR domain-containing protein n=1 Tax=Saccharopolyspora kobensis TaxID=146035 RepID=A0A1H6AJQ1_9PSEU|nr:toll/interleukin-1 receptor domain-containing protein [Saccharopolyspora kobensis]SEG48235.1 TIR domain-containing protein [Saccharopolyspora kobensis]SFE57524.1 TIR domain-containing protein [Saccharopolyspora kobensis]
MSSGSGARSWPRQDARSTAALIIVLTLTSWVMYSALTEFESDLSHGREELGTLVLGVLAAAEVVATVLVLSGHKRGLVVVVPAEALRSLIPLVTSADASISVLAVINLGLLGYVLLRSDELDDAVPAPRARGTGAAVGREDGSGKPDVFLSYSRRQFHFAESLMLRLEGRAVSTWFDTHRIRAGEDWRESIERGLSVCTSLLLVASREALASPEVDYEWRTALERGKKLYVVLFEAVELPPELRGEAVAIIDMRTRFEPKAETLAELLAQPRHHRDEIPRRKPFGLPLPQPAGTSLIAAALLLILLVSLFFDFLNARTLVAITTPHPKNIPVDYDESFTTRLLGITFHGMSSKVYAFLGITTVTLLLTAFAAFLLVALLQRRRFRLSLLRATLLGACWLYLNTSFIDHSTSHIVVSGGGGLVLGPGNTNSSAWRDVDDMLLGRYVEYGSPSSSSEYESPFLSVGDVGPHLTATSALWRWPTLLLIAFAVVAWLAVQRSSSLYRWLATGSAPDELRLRHNGLPGASRSAFAPISGRELGERRRWRLLHHPADSHVAAEIARALDERVPAGSQRRTAIVLLSNHTRLAWLENLERDEPDLVYVVCTNIRETGIAELIGRHQWFDYRERSYDKLSLLARALEADSSRNAGYAFPALPESLARTVLPRPVRYKSHVMRLLATWSLAVALFGQGAMDRHFDPDGVLLQLVPVLVELMSLLSIPCSLYLFWLALRLASSRISHDKFQRHQNIVMSALLVSQLQFLLAFTDVFSIVLLGTLFNAFLAMAWFTPDPDELRRWLPEREPPAETAGTLTVPVKHQFGPSTALYLALFAICYLTSAIFFADLA